MDTTQADVERQMSILADRLENMHLGHDWQDGRRVINPDGLTENCYFCTAAFLGGFRDVHELVQRTETMQQCRANLSEICALFEAAGIHYTGHQTTTPLEAQELFNGRVGGLAYTRQDGSGHMVAFNHGLLIDTQSNTRGNFDTLLGEQATTFWFFFV